MKNSPFQPEDWVDLHGDPLFRYALGRVCNREFAENLVQETFLSALKVQATFSSQSAQRTWLTAILKHKIIDHYRQNYRENPITDLKNEEQSIDEFFNDTQHYKKKPSSWVAQAPTALEKTEFWQTVQNCLQKLPQRIADAFSLKEVENMEPDEICKLLNIPPTHLWIMLHCARLQLRQCLEINWFEKE